MALISIAQEPKTYNQARTNPKWQEAMRNELNALESNETWEITTLPVDKQPVGCKWVYRIKYNADGSIDRYKARLVAKGYTQVEGEDYSEIFSPVAKIVSVRLMIAMVAANNWCLHQIDVSNAFLHGRLEDEIYMLPPPGYDKVQIGEVYKLKISIYGLKQASRQWNVECTKKLTEYGFVQSPYDHCFFSHVTSDHFVSVLVYVDDVLLAGSNVEAVNCVKSFLHDAFTIKDLDCTPACTPLPAGIKFQAMDHESSPLLEHPE